MNTMSDTEKVNILMKFQEDNKEVINDARKFLRKNSVSFLHNIAFLSGGVISLTVGFLPALYNINEYRINQYKKLYILSIIFLASALILGLLYRYVYSEWIAMSANNEMLKKLEEVFGKKVQEYQKDYRREERKWIISRVIIYLCPTLFFIGIILTFLYFSSQVFDFEMGCFDSFFVRFR